MPPRKSRAKPKTPAEPAFSDGEAAPIPQTIRSRRGGNFNVAGPTSALTSFLKEHGIQASVGRSGWAPAPGQNTDELALPGPSSPSGSRVEPSREASATPVTSEATVEKRKRPAVNGKGKGRATEEDLDSDDLDEVMPKKRARKRIASPSSSALDGMDGDGDYTPIGTRTPSGVNTPAETRLRPVGEFMTCVDCQNQFTVTAYTKPCPSKPGYLCYDCAISAGIDVFAKTRKKAAAKKPAAKDKRAKVISYEEITGPIGLGDFCIKLIGKYIEDVEALGNIGTKSMDRVCRIISKSRRLTPETATLFYSGNRTELKMYDCTNLLPSSYVTLAALCPNLQDLSLELCGQLDTDTIIKWGQVFPDLKRLDLWGPFNVRKEGWVKFFADKPDLEGLLITQTPRFDMSCLKAMVNNCPDINELRFREFGLLDDTWLPELAKLEKLELLDLSSPGHASLTDEPVIELLKAIGENLETLNLGDHIRLTDRVLLDGIVPHCPRIRKLFLRNIADFAPPQEGETYVKTGLTNAGVADFFAKWKESGHSGLVEVDLSLNPELGEKSLLALMEHSGDTLIDMNIKGWRETPDTTLARIGVTCSKLRSLNVGWCRQLTDLSVKDILGGCPEITVIKAWGCNSLTDNVARKKGCRLTGIESHVISA